MSGTKPTPRHGPSSAIAPIPPGTLPIPSDFVIARTLYFTGELPAYPTFTPGSAATAPLGTKKWTWWVHYTPGADGGFPRFHILVGNGDDYGSSVVLDVANFAITNSPFGTTPFYLEEVDGPPQAVVDGERVYSITLLILPAACTQLGLAVSEAGVPATPGTAQIYYTGQG
jgi:hypothetical protein